MARLVLVLVVALFADVAYSMSPVPHLLDFQRAEGQTGTLKCHGAHTVLDIHYAKYGVIGGACGNNDLVRHLAIVKEACQHRKSCILPATNAVFKDPCLFTAKALQVKYLCRPGHDLLINEGSSETIKCDHGMMLDILFAKYGVPDLACGSYKKAQHLLKVKELCEHKASCALTASNDVFGDPCLLTAKKLEVSYTCKHIANAILTSVIPEPLLGTLQCPKDHLLDITYAKYGIPDGACGNNDAPRHLLIVKEACQNRMSCILPATNAVFKDPCFLTQKKLLVHYKCKPGHVWQINEHTSGTLQCPKGKGLDILYAKYGVPDLACGSYSKLGHLAIVKQACDNEEACHLTASNGFFKKDPCPLTPKKLSISYLCKPKAVDYCATKNPCMNGAACHHIANSVSCTCLHGYTGKNCQTEVNNCLPNPCKNGAKCTNAVGDFTCFCPLGFTGKNCDQVERYTMLVRERGNVDFNRKWADYKKGFGNCAHGDCWIGLTKLRKLCHENCKLQIAMTFNGKNKHAVYNTFMIGPEDRGYKLTIGDYTHDSNAGDDLMPKANGMRFSTKDRDNDLWHDNCAAKFSGGWWYNSCFWAHPTGTWGNKAFAMGVNWKSLTGFKDTLSSIIMKVTPMKYEGTIIG